MARIRSIKPEFFQDEKLARVSRDARLLFIGIWCWADDYGVVKGHPAYLKQLFLYDTDLQGPQIESLVQELLDGFFVASFSEHGETYLAVVNWKKHQRVDHVSKVRNPPPPETFERPTEGLARLSREPREPSCTDQDQDQDQDQDLTTLSSKLDLVPDPPPPVSKEPTPAEVVFAYWASKLRPRAKLDPKRRRLVQERLREGFTVEDLKLAVDGCGMDPFSQGENDRHQKFDDLALICRDAGHVERFIAIAKAGPKAGKGTVPATPDLLRQWGVPT